MFKKTIIILLTLMAATLPLFSQGARELQNNENLYKVISVTDEGDGIWRLDCIRESGEEVVFRTNPETSVCETAMENLGEGSIVAIVDTGIATMSIPPQMFVANIRDVSLAVGLGIYDADFSQQPPALPGAVATAEDETATEVVQVAETVQPANYEMVSPDYLPEGMIPRFSYTIGYLNGQDLFANPTYLPDAGYFIKGILDLSKFDLSATLMTTDEMVEAYNSYYENYIAAGVVASAGVPHSSLEEIDALAVPSTDHEKFSYAYGYILASQIMMGGIELDVDGFATGLLDGLYGFSSRLTEEEMQASYEEYQNYLYQVYEEMIAQLKEDNLKEANEFMESNSTSEGIIGINPGVQMLFTHQEDGAIPKDTDTVRVNYTLRTLDGVELERNEDIEFPLDQVIPGFTLALTNMHVGDSATVYVHPDYGYGENGAGSIEPNQLLIFDLDLLGIVDPAEAEV